MPLLAVSGYSENASPIDFSVSSQQQQQQQSHFLQRDVKTESASSTSADLQHQHQQQQLLLMGSDPSKLPQLLNPVDLDQSISKYLAANGAANDGGNVGSGEPPSVDQARTNIDTDELRFAPATNKILLHDYDCLR